MECHLVSLHMHIPLPVLQGILASLCPVPASCMILSNRRQTISRPCLLSLRLRSSACSALKTAELKCLSTDPVLEEIENPHFQVHDGLNIKPLRFCTADRSSNILGRNAKGQGRRNLERLGSGTVRNVDEKGRLKWCSERLRHCALHFSLNEGKAIHGLLLKNGIDPDTHLWISLINFYAKCHDLRSARQVLDEMPERDVVSWTALIAGFVAEGCSSDAINLFVEMRKEGIRPNEFSLATCLKAGSMCLDLEFGKQLHAEIVKLGAFWDIYIGSALVDLYAKSGELEYADSVFAFMPGWNAVSWNALLNGYAQMGDWEEVLKLFCRMRESDIKFNKFTLSTVLKSFANSGNVEPGRAMHSFVIKTGCELDEFVNSTLVDMYSKCGLADDALKAFMGAKNHDIVSWTAIISCLDQQGQQQEAAKLFHLMRDAGVRPNQFTLTSLISSASDLNPHFAESIHACVYKYGFQNEDLVSNALIAMYMKIGYVGNGCRVFSVMNNRDVVSWNALLSGFHDGEISDQGPRIFRQMLVEGFKPNIYTFISILRSCSGFSNANFGKQVHAHVIKESLDKDGFIGTALIDMYAKSRSLEDVGIIFDRLNERDLFTWTVMISSYAQAEQGERALQCFSQMQKEGIKPNEFTLASCLRGCAGLSSIHSGTQLHSFAIKSGQFKDVFVASALVDLYGKCGCIEDAEIVFKGMDSCDTVAWNTIICGYSQHGQGNKALEAFKIMVGEGIMPDGITFLGILSACSHMCLTEEGKMHFNLMNEVYGIIPSIEHYACMVDILGRAGKFDEVETFIGQMEVTPSALIWETVLGACMIHGNVELGENVAKRLFELKPEKDSTYILLSNIYAAKGRWNDVSKVRALMSSQGVKKEPGCSWVEVDAQTHAFLSQDGSHPKTLEIYQKLEELSKKLISVGYDPNPDYVLHNTSNQEKKENLIYHSERLALAFALISDTPNKTIRIFKNLRICGDCHDFMKLVSEMTDREIVVRDLKRFHHFRHGTCSCQDYW
ncbi:hypothetical protein NMG60_11033418 [Bertholletia excelsa]